ncbi:MAG: type-F conjugative transfer system secretin TraK [Candidatus Omnitrophica bacterium]|nr:type-F conjugative transfer system secretin TraK [Candidatus Omnitrophota bacterium]
MKNLVVVIRSDSSPLMGEGIHVASIMKNLIIGVCMGVFLCFGGVQAAGAKDEGRPVEIKVEIGKVSEVAFPEKVSKVVKGGAPDSVLVEVLDHSVYLLPKTNPPADIFVTTTAGISYPLSLRISKERDIKVQVGVFHSGSPGSSSWGYGDVMDVMRDLLLKKEPAMATVLPQKGEVFLSNGQIRLTVDKAYELGRWKAYVLTARNQIKNAVIIPVQQITMPHLLAISTERDLLSARGREGDKAQVYIIIGQ